MTLADIRNELLHIAAEMVRGEGLPSDDDEDHPPRRTRGYWLTQLERAHNSNKAKAMRLKAVFDKLGALERAEKETSALCPHGMPLAENVCGPCSEGKPNTWRCTVCNLLNPTDATHCRQCEYSRMVMRDGKQVPRDEHR